MIAVAQRRSVIDAEGHVVWRVRVVPGELTCTGCGEVAMGGSCPNCSSDDEGNRYGHNPPPLVPTESYLYPGEYEVR
jgi:hypothetical protein